jgi:exosortase
MRELIDTVVTEAKLLWQKTKAMPSETRGRLVLFLVMLLFVLASYAFTFSIIRASWQRPEYEFGPLIPLLALIVLWIYRQPIIASSTWEQLGGVALIMVCTVARYLSLHQFSMQQPMYYTLIGCLVGLVMILGGIKMLRWTWPSLLLLLLAIPFSAKMEKYSFQKLQKYSTKCSVYALETVGVDVVTEAEGNKIMLRRNSEDVQLNVAEACAGFKGMLTTVALTLTVVLLIEADLWIKIILVISAPLIALFANIVRIVLQSLCYQISEDAAVIFHDYVAGFVVYPLIFGLLYLNYVILQNLVLDDKQELALPQSPANPIRKKLPQPVTMPVPNPGKR